MAKDKTVYFCQECGYESAKWMGQCPSCKSWNSFAEEKITPTKGGAGLRGGGPTGRKAEPVSLNAVEAETDERTTTGIGEDRKSVV